METLVKITKSTTFFNVAAKTFIVSNTTDAEIQIAFADDFVESESLIISTTQEEKKPQVVEYKISNSLPVRVLHGRVKMSVVAAEQLITSLQTSIAQTKQALTSAMGG